MAEEQHDGDGDRGGDEILQNADAKHALAASDPFGSIVLPGEGGAGLAERVEHVVGDDFDVERGAGGGHDNGAETVDGGLDDDVGHGEHRALHAGGQSDAQDLTQGEPVDAELAQINMDGCVSMNQSIQQNHGADDVRDDGGRCDARNTPMEQYDENQSHGHVEHAGNGEYGERSLGVADAAEDGCFEIV